MARTRLTPIQTNIPYKFSAYRAAAFSANTSAITTVVIDTKNFDTGTNFSTATGLFTAPVAGFYFFAASGGCTALTAGVVIACALIKNGSETLRGTQADVGATASDVNAPVSGILQLAANDTVGFGLYAGAANTGAVGSNRTWFTGFLVSAT